MMNVGIITPGKICPGVNTCINQIALREKHRHSKVWGIVEGWKGLNYGFMEEFLVCDSHSQPGTIIHTSREPLQLKYAKKHVEKFDVLYCIGDRDVQIQAKNLMTLDVHTNIVGVTGFGFQSEVQEIMQYIKKAHVLAHSAHAVVFLEIADKTGELLRYTAMSSPEVDVVITPDCEENYLFDVQHEFAMNGHCVVLVSESVQYNNIIDALGLYTIGTKIIKPGELISVVEPCVSDNIAASRAARQACDHAQEHSNFVCSGGAQIIPYAHFPVNNSLVRI
jgi:6-phosphofructokinase 1